MSKIFNFLKKLSNKSKEKSIEKYAPILSEDTHTNIRFKYLGVVYTTYVDEIKDSEIIFRCPGGDYNRVNLPLNKIMNINLISNNELYTTNIMIREKIINDDAVFYRATIEGVIDQSKRRKYYRLPIDLPLEFSFATRPNIKYAGHTVDLSPEGMLLETFEDIMINKDIVIEITIEGVPYIINGQVLRRRTNFQNGDYLYNIKFDGISNKHKKEINSFINYKRQELEDEKLKDAYYKEKDNLENIEEDIIEEDNATIEETNIENSNENLENTTENNEENIENNDSENVDEKNSEKENNKH